MPKITLKKVKDPDNRFDLSDVLVEADIETLDELADVITSFIHACGYSSDVSCVFSDGDEEE